jgi:hypothetical protein
LARTSESVECRWGIFAPYSEVQETVHAQYNQ